MENEPEKKAVLSRDAGHALTERGGNEHHLHSHARARRARSMEREGEKESERPIFCILIYQQANEGSGPSQSAFLITASRRSAAPTLRTVHDITQSKYWRGPSARRSPPSPHSLGAVWAPIRAVIMMAPQPLVLHRPPSSFSQGIFFDLAPIADSHMLFVGTVVTSMLDFF